MVASTSPVTRIIRAVLTIWLTFILTQPVAVHACAMRNGTLRSVPVSATSSLQENDPAMTGDMAGMMGAMDHSTPSPGGTNTKCHCFGDCATPIPAALFAASYSLVPAPPQLLVAPIVSTAVERSFEEPTHLHPPATAPPAAIA